jgi:hypothetical protein
MDPVELPQSNGSGNKMVRRSAPLGIVPQSSFQFPSTRLGLWHIGHEAYAPDPVYFHEYPQSFLLHRIGLPTLFGGRPTLDLADTLPLQHLRLRICP